jgi:hypothetical protein
VIFHRDTPEDDGRPEYLAPSGRVWRRYDHWQVPPMTRAHTTSYLRRYGADPAAEADPAPHWHWLEVTEVAWRGWVLHRTGNILGRVAHLTRDDGRTPPAVIWLPLSADGRLIGDSCASAGQGPPGRGSARRRRQRGCGGPRVCHRRLPAGGHTEDAERQPETG